MSRKKSIEDELKDAVAGLRAHVSVALSTENAADICRRNGWIEGDVLEGDEGYGPTQIRITAIGEETVLARGISHKGKPMREPEQCWGLSGRKWKKVTAFR